jgi:hypothetical protein
VRRRTFGAYGLQVRSTFDLPIVDLPTAGSPEPYEQVDLTLRLVDEEEIAGNWSNANGVPSWQTMFPSHCHVRLDRGQAGDHLLTFGRKASFHLDRGGRTLCCASTEEDRSEWKFFLLDTVLYCVSLIRGFEALHASAVCIEDSTCALVGTSGAGKSTLAAELLRRGCDLFADDVLSLSPTDRAVLAHAAPPLMTLPDSAQAIEEVGELLAVSTEQERSLVQVGRTSGDPQPLSAIFILDRGSRAALQPLQETAHGRLLPHMLSLDRRPARALSRFALLRKLVEQTPVYRLCLGHGDLAEAASIVEEELRTAEPSQKIASRPMHHASAA